MPGLAPGADSVDSQVEPLLQIRNLRTYFDTDAGVARAVDGISLSVRRGETVGLVGESGCGKTVTALSVLGLVPAPRGRILEGSSIRLRGRELTALSPAELRKVRGREIAMIFQEPDTSLNPVYRVGDQVAEAVRLHRRVGRRRARRLGEDLLREVGIPEPEERFHAYPHQLSGGMRQRVMIAMALAGEPDLLIADEPTTALDVTIQAQILELLARISTARGMAVLLITHDLGVVAEFCHRMIVMYAGEVVEKGGVEGVFADPGHPYTRGLLASMPRPGPASGGLRPIEGSVPSPVRWPGGCRFHPRCPHAWERCRAQHPELFQRQGVGEDHAESGVEWVSRCWLEVEPEGGAS